MLLWYVLGSIDWTSLVTCVSFYLINSSFIVNLRTIYSLRELKHEDEDDHTNIGVLTIMFCTILVCYLRLVDGLF
jgi:hypothetical protein